MKRNLTLIGLLICSMGVLAQKHSIQSEKLIYDGYYNWGFIWVKAAEVEMTATNSIKYPDARKINVICSTNSSWDWIFKMRDTLTSYHHEDTFLPYEFSRKAHEGNYHKTFDYRFDYEQNCAHALICRIGRYTKKDTIMLKPNTYDMLSTAWKARDMDFERFKKNDTIPMNVLIDDEISSIYVRYLGTEKIKLENNKRDCYVFAPMLLKGDVFQGGEEMKVWISRDAERIPLMVEAKILIGSIKGILRSSEIKYNKQ